MSRRVPSSQHPLVYQTSVDNTDQATSSTACLSNTRLHVQPKKYLQYQNSNNIESAPSCSRGLYNNVVYDTGISEDSCAETNSYYNYYRYGKPFSSKKDQTNNEYVFSDSDSSQLPDYEYNQIPSNRCSRNFSVHSFGNKDNFHRGEKYASFVHKDLKKVYPNENTLPPRLTIINPPNIPNAQYPVGFHHFLERPRSALSSEVTSAIVDGCGGRCQTFENICYYFLQVAFTMGILIGTSLCIAGAVLRKSASRNLQVLIYIGAILIGVSALLLAIQCNARCNARKRKKATRTKRVNIPLETLHSNPVDFQQIPLEDNSGRLVVNLPLQNVQPKIVRNSNFVEHQGVPWWRRKDIN